MDELKREEKIVNSIKRDVGYDIYTEQIVDTRIPVVWFMSQSYANAIE